MNIFSSFLCQRNVKMAYQNTGKFIIMLSLAFLVNDQYYVKTDWIFTISVLCGWFVIDLVIQRQKPSHRSPISLDLCLAKKHGYMYLFVHIKQ